ncbi:hypothetical protein GCM10010156_48860 [Planobispora rosea]|uniref:Uncharacterized protein n=1 Tax=Planobispora rosea TaxID=35762 RepID=A0A8J3S5P8_PLARO|nr:hypothetical protein [Planobispora rosea]GGS84475.1 hypothetical protein GCM10010156_48860 [Planobispora rosea]GIH86397.1 hypothetical protein Pro02_48050 [Planobispora rosea]
MILNPLMGRETFIDGLLLWPVGAPDRHLGAVVAYRADQPDRLQLTFMSTDMRRTFDYTLSLRLLEQALAPGAPGPDGAEEELDTEGLQQVDFAPAPGPEHLVIRLWMGEDDGADGETGEWFPLYAARARLNAITERIRLLHADVDAAITAIFSEATP